MTRPCAHSHTHSHTLSPLMTSLCPSLLPPPFFPLPLCFRCFPAPSEEFGAASRSAVCVSQDKGISVAKRAANILGDVLANRLLRDSPHEMRCCLALVQIVQKKAVTTGEEHLKVWSFPPPPCTCPCSAGHCFVAGQYYTSGGGV